MSEIAKIDQTRKLAIQADIDRLSATIFEDTRKAAEQIARREGWTIDTRRTSDDWTDRVAFQLQSQWNGVVSR
jgi:hypothetical protein